jgi:cytochrome P450
MGFANLTFAGGRDTIIHTVSSVCAYFGRHPESLDYLRKDPGRVVHACEEFFRALSPLTHIGRVCPVDTEVEGFEVKAGGRVSLCWASANQDEKAFDAPGEVRLDRRPNPHVAFGFGPHVCVGAPHARLVLRTLVQKCAEQLAGIQLLEEKEHVEEQASYQRSIGFESLKVRFRPLVPQA